MAVPRVDEMDGRPEVGRWYLVPAIWMNRFGFGELWWPVVGPLHTDVEFFHFKAPHYHVDARFLTVRHLRQNGTNRFTDDPASAALETPVIKPFAHRQDNPEPPPKPEYRHMQCRRFGCDYPYASMRQVQELRSHFSGAVAPRNASGHIVCPHRGARIDQLVPDEDGIVTCPLHGLRVHLSTCKVVE